MGFLKFRRSKNDDSLDFSDVTTHEKIEKLRKKGILTEVYLFPIRFNGKKSIENIVYVPEFVVEQKERYDDIVEKLLVEGKASSYRCVAEYKGDSKVPSSLVITIKGQGFLRERINIW